MKYRDWTSYIFDELLPKASIFLLIVTIAMIGVMITLLCWGVI